jgi:hypothetical protein
MKKVLLIALSLLMITSVIYAQDKDQVEEVKIVLVKEEGSDNYYYEGVVPVEGVSKEEMFKRAKEWVLSKFKTEDNNAQFDEQNLVILNSPTIVLEKYRGAPGDFLYFKIKILFKDGKYKFRFDNLIVKSNTFPLEPPVSYNGVKMFTGRGAKYNPGVIRNVNHALLGLSAELDSMIKETKTKKDDW